MTHAILYRVLEVTEPPGRQGSAIGCHWLEERDARDAAARYAKRTGTGAEVWTADYRGLPLKPLARVWHGGAMWVDLRELKNMRPSLMCPSRSNPYDEDDGVSELQDAVLGLLEAGGIPADVNDQIMRLIDKAEADAFAETEDEQPVSPEQC